MVLNLFLEKKFSNSSKTAQTDFKRRELLIKEHKLLTIQILFCSHPLLKNKVSKVTIRNKEIVPKFEDGTNGC
jgi:hypothetical protein